MTAYTVRTGADNATSTKAKRSGLDDERVLGDSSTMLKTLTTAAVLAAMTIPAYAGQSAKEWAITHCDDPEYHQYVFLLEQSGVDYSENDRVVIGKYSANWFTDGRTLFLYGNGTPNFVLRGAQSGEGNAPTTFNPARERPTRCDALPGYGAQVE